jgi:hypothetical protein
MINLSEMGNSLENIPMLPDQKKAMLQLIDAKVNSDMKEVITEIRHLEGKIQLLDSRIQMVHDKLSNEIKVVYWVIGIAMAIMLMIVARK